MFFNKDDVIVEYTKDSGYSQIARAVSEDEAYLGACVLNNKASVGVEGFVQDVIVKYGCNYHETVHMATESDSRKFVNRYYRGV